MIKRLRKVGNSSALILDRPLLDLLGMETQGEVQITARDGSLILTPVTPRRASPEEFEKALARVISRRRSVLRRLAE